MDVRITHCAICWGFRQRALAIADVLKEKYGATVEITEGALGQFDVYVDGKRVLSRGGSLVARLKPPRLPDTASVLAALEHSRPAANRASVNVDPLQHKFDSADARQFYDRFGARQDLQFYEHAALDTLIARSDFEQASTVFEIGCGTGRLAKNLLKEHLPENASYVGIDISTTMVLRKATPAAPLNH